MYRCDSAEPGCLFALPVKQEGHYNWRLLRAELPHALIRVSLNNPDVPRVVQRRLDCEEVVDAATSLQQLDDM
ncbi:hypothetical protein MTO96_002996 [Rhipicephalus appendiculatus]